MKSLLPYAIFAAAAALEVFGDLGIRRWALQPDLSKAPFLAFGAAALVSYGLALNILSSPQLAWLIGIGRPIEFGPLLGFYISVFFAVSQLVSVLLLEEPYPVGPVRWAGCAMIVVGGLAFQFGGPK